LKMYNNNIPQNIDTQCNEELMLLIERAKQEDDGIIRDASCGYNTYNNELYLNMPCLPTIGIGDGRMLEYGQHLQHYHQRAMYGHIYVFALTDEYTTKYGNRSTLYDDIYSVNGRIIDIEITDTRQYIRKYFNNSLGEMRSGDILPSVYGSIYNLNAINQDGMLYAGIFIETPYDIMGDGRIFRDYDLIYSGRWLDQNIDRYQLGTLADTFADDAVGFSFSTVVFPQLLPVPILSRFKSKFFTQTEETAIKRVRRVNVNVYSRGPITLKGISIPFEGYDERIDNVALELATQTFNYSPSQSAVQPFTGGVIVGTNNAILSFIPRTPYQPPSGTDPYPDWLYNDRYAKPVRYSVEVEGSYRTQINALSLFIRGINKYLT